MIRRIYLLAIFLCTISCMYATHLQNEVHARSFMFTRPASSRLTRTQQIWHAIAYHSSHKGRTGTQVAVFYEQSISKERVARYFLPDSKNEFLLIAGDQAPINLRLARDVRAEWLNLPNDFSGRMCIAPKQRQAGVSLDVHQDVCALTDISFLQNWWIHASLPIVWVENDIQFHQFDIVRREQVGQVNDIASAFNQPSWCFAKIDGLRSKVRPAELSIRFGSTYRADRWYEFTYYSLVLVPFDNRQNPEFLFNPFVGHNGHAGYGGGVHLQMPLNRDVCETAFLFFLDLESIYLLRRRQKRTFDLKDKPWSRYMLYNLKTGEQNVPGVNLLTFDVTSHPYAMFEMSSGIRVRQGFYEVQLGYGVWGYSNERLKFRSPFHECFGIAGDGAMLPSGEPATASNSDITKRAPNDAKFVPIKKENIDLCSAAAASAVNHIVHVALGISGCTQTAEGIVGIGGFVEFAQRNRPLSLWGTWVKMGIAF